MMTDSTSATPPNRFLILPIVIITLGVGWLLTALKVGPGIDWIWTIGLGAAGILTFATGGFDKLTVVVGPFLLVSSTLSILRQTGRLSVDVEAPILVIVFGVLMLVAQAPMIPHPKWYEPPRK